MFRAIFQGIGRLYGLSRWTRFLGDAASVSVFVVLIAVVHALFSWEFLEYVSRDMQMSLSTFLDWLWMGGGE